VILKSLKAVHLARFEASPVHCELVKSEKRLGLRPSFGDFLALPVALHFLEVAPPSTNVLYIYIVYTEVHARMTPLHARRLGPP